MERARKIKFPAILFEDECLIAFDKPAGMQVAHGGEEAATGKSLMQMVQQRATGFVQNVHKLENAVSGILICAKNKKVHDFMCGQFQARTVAERFIAMVRPCPGWKDMKVDQPIAFDPEHQERMRLVKNGREAVTEFRVVDSWRDYALVEAVPRTSRMHQIRLHAMAAGVSVIGDTLYGRGHVIMLSSLKRNYKFKEYRDERPLLGRLAIHAASVTFRHPETGAETTVTAPMPHDFAVAIKYLTKFISRA